MLKKLKIISCTSFDLKFNCIQYIAKTKELTLGQFVICLQKIKYLYYRMISAACGQTNQSFHFKSMSFSSIGMYRHGYGSGSGVWGKRSRYTPRVTVNKVIYHNGAGRLVKCPKEGSYTKNPERGKSKIRVSESTGRGQNREIQKQPKIKETMTKKGRG